MGCKECGKILTQDEEEKLDGICVTCFTQLAYEYEQSYPVHPDNKRGWLK